jgi:Kef-type K+ transport system membrane component KefB
LGYGFRVPLFFVASRAALDLPGLFGNPRAFLMMPVFLALMVLARGVPALLLYRQALVLAERKALAAPIARDGKPSRWSAMARTWDRQPRRRGG